MENNLVQIFVPGKQNFIVQIRQSQKFNLFKILLRLSHKHTDNSFLFKNLFESFFGSQNFPNGIDFMLKVFMNFFSQFLDTLKDPIFKVENLNQLASYYETKVMFAEFQLKIVLVLSLFGKVQHYQVYFVLLNQRHFTQIFHRIFDFLELFEIVISVDEEDKVEVVSAGELEELVLGWF